MSLRWVSAGNQRKLRVTAQPNATLTMAHVPPHCRRARTVLLGPLTPEDLDAASFMSHQPGGVCPACRGHGDRHHRGPVSHGIGNMIVRLRQAGVTSGDTKDEYHNLRDSTVDTMQRFTPIRGVHIPCRHFHCCYW